MEGGYIYNLDEWILEVDCAGLAISDDEATILLSQCPERGNPVAEEYIEYLKELGAFSSTAITSSEEIQSPRLPISDLRCA